MRVLVVDDHLEALAGICKLVQAQGHDVVGVADRQAALEEAGTQKPDLVLLDVHLRNESGLDVARRLLSTHSDLPVILISMDQVDPAEIRASGARAFILKDALLTADLDELAR